MYKAIKDNKIISINETGDFSWMELDTVQEDKEHTCKDYVEYNGEFILKEDVPPPTEEEQRQKRQQAFVEEADPLRYNYDEDCARYGYDSEQALASKELWLAKKDEIRERYPYPEEEQ